MRENKSKMQDKILSVSKNNIRCECYVRSLYKTFWNLIAL